MTTGMTKQQYLQQKVRDRAAVSVYLNSGVQLKGNVTGYDEKDKTLFLTPDVMIFESNIASVVGRTEQ